MGKGYIGITDRQWFEFLKNKKGIAEFNFWRKNIKQFKSLESGNIFLFLVKNEKGISKEREVLGYAIFDRYEVLSINEAWEKYKEGNGTYTKDDFVERMQKVYKEEISTSQIGCIILKDMFVFNNGVKLSEVEINFQTSIVSGKNISEEDAYNIINAGNSNDELIIKEIIMEDIEGYFVKEGNRVLIQHLKRERNLKIIREAKRIFIQRHGSLHCEICSFDYENKYGDYGQGYIEGHHNKPLNKYVDEDITKIEDIVMVCANCHRILHKNNITVTELKDFLVTTSVVPPSE